MTATVPHCVPTRISLLGAWGLHLAQVGLSQDSLDAGISTLGLSVIRYRSSTAHMLYRSKYTGSDEPHGWFQDKTGDESEAVAIVSHVHIADVRTTFVVKKTAESDSRS